MKTFPRRSTRMRNLGVRVRSPLGHCMGSAVVAEAVALGHVAAEEVDRIVLMTLGLFYEAPIDSRLKSRGAHPRAPAAQGAVESYRSTHRQGWHWEVAGRLASGLEESVRRVARRSAVARRKLQTTTVDVNCMCNRLSFMYGMPYHHHNLSEIIHGSKRSEVTPGAEPGAVNPKVDPPEAELPKQFGAIPLRMYHSTPPGTSAGDMRRFFLKTTAVRETMRISCRRKRTRDFESLEKVTLITGALNRLWHRDSIDLMHEWLCRGSSKSLRTFHKQIFPDYAHQDLLWGEHASSKVFPTIAAGLRRDQTPGPSSEIASAD